MVFPPPPVEKGLRKADEDELKDLFYTRLMEAGYSPSRARGHLPEFRVELRTIRGMVKDLPRDRAVRGARDAIEALVERILVRKPPVAVPAVPEVPEIVPIVPLIAPPTVPGVTRMYDMPWAFHPCPACLGEEKAPEECMVMRSPYLERRLRMMGIPTTDPLFYRLCDDHKTKYGATFEQFPRNKIEFWVGALLASPEYDTTDFTAFNITLSYLMYAKSFYEDHKHETTPPFLS